MSATCQFLLKQLKRTALSFLFEFVLDRVRLNFAAVQKEIAIRIYGRRNPRYLLDYEAGKAILSGSISKILVRISHTNDIWRKNGSRGYRFRKSEGKLRI